MNAVTRSQKRRSLAAGSLSLEAMSEGTVQQLRAERILQAQDKEDWIVDLKAYLKGEVEKRSANKLRNALS